MRGCEKTKEESNADGVENGRKGEPLEYVGTEGLLQNRAVIIWRGSENNSVYKRLI